MAVTVFREAVGWICRFGNIFDPWRKQPDGMWNHERIGMMNYKWIALLAFKANVLLQPKLALKES